MKFENISDDDLKFYHQLFFSDGKSSYLLQKYLDLILNPPKDENGNQLIIDYFNNNNNEF